MTDIEIRPGTRCFACGGSKYWHYKDKQAVNCCKCHPAPPGADIVVFEVEEPKSDDEIEQLRARVAAGVEKLMTAWLKILEMPEPEFDAQSKRFFESCKRLVELCTQLQLMGYNDCLFDDYRGTKKCRQWPKDLPCWVCPMPPEKFWKEKIEERPRIINHPISERGKQTIEFLKKLGAEI